MQPQESTDLFARAHRGDSQARAELLQRCRPRVLTRIRMMMGPDARRIAESSDFLASVLLKALERMDVAAFEDETHLTRWMTAVARNGIRDDMRRGRERALESFSSSAEIHLACADKSASPMSQADLEDRVARVIECMEQLDDEERSLVELRNLEGLTFTEIARRLEWSDDKARLAHLRAMARLGQMLGAARAR